MSRNYTIRKMRNLGTLPEDMTYPYGYIEEPQEGYDPDYTVEGIRHPIVVEPVSADAGNFPHNILEHFWIRLGENDGDSWLSTGVLTNGNYFFYTGSCDYSGFGCQGGMRLWVSSSWQNIVDHTMSEWEYDTYVMDTELVLTESERRTAGAAVSYDSPLPTVGANATHYQMGSSACCGAPPTIRWGMDACLAPPGY